MENQIYIGDGRIPISTNWLDSEVRRAGTAPIFNNS